MSFNVLLLAVCEFLFCLTEAICDMSKFVTGFSLWSGWLLLLYLVLCGLWTDLEVLDNYCDSANHWLVLLAHLYLYLFSCSCLCTSCFRNKKLLFLFYNQHMFWDLFMFLVLATIILVLLAHLYLYLEHLNSSSATVLDKSLKLCVVAFRLCSVPSNFQKKYKIPRHIEFLDACMKH
jgi:hypothetical protein